jgi:hypothetical protein
MHKGARTDPCGGRGVTRAPTATRRIICLTFLRFRRYWIRRSARPRDGDGSSTKKLRKASYCRWRGVAGATKIRRHSISV